MQLASIQLLRAFAALSVAIGHGQAFIGTPLERQGGTFGWSFLFPWGAGVDLFFVISGFIMVYSSETLFAQAGGAGVFLWRRLLRIAPLYWAATAFAIVKEAVKGHGVPGFADLATSLLFIPWDSAGNGLPRPVYELGWTLNYEMFFYILFAVAIAQVREKAVLLVTSALLALIVCGPLVPLSNAALQVWTQPITAEFVFGMVLALMVRRGVVLPAALRIGLVGAASVVLLWDGMHSSAQPFGSVTPNDATRALAWGLPSAMIVAAAMLGRQFWRDNYLTKLGTALGDASYALYLFHPFVMSAFSAGWFAMKLQTRTPPWLPVTLSVVVACAVAMLIHRWFERPLTETLKRLPITPKLRAQAPPMRRPREAEPTV